MTTTRLNHSHKHVNNYILPVHSFLDPALFKFTSVYLQNQRNEERETTILSLYPMNTSEREKAISLAFIKDVLARVHGELTMSFLNHNSTELTLKVRFKIIKIYSVEQPIFYCCNGHCCQKTVPFIRL